MTETVLDATGLSCPLPVLRARKLLKKLPDGAALTVLATDANSPRDFEKYCGETGLTFLGCEEKEGPVFHIRVQKP